VHTVIPLVQVNDLRTEVYNRIRELIFSGYFKSGQKIEENELARLLGVSRTPVREALNRLESRYIVVRVPRRGTFVRKISLKEITELFTIRGLLEGNSAKLAAENSSEKDIKELIKILDLMKKTSDRDTLEDLNRKLHMFIHSFAGEITKNLITEYYEFLVYVDRILLSGIDSEDRIKEIRKEHEEIITAIKAHDPEKAEKAARSHADKGLDNVKVKYDRAISEGTLSS